MTNTLATRIVLPDVPPPGGPYSHGIAVSGAGTWLHIAGQVGMAVDGSVSSDCQSRPTTPNCSPASVTTRSLKDLDKYDCSFRRSQRDTKPVICRERQDVGFFRSKLARSNAGDFGFED